MKIIIFANVKGQSLNRQELSNCVVGKKSPDSIRAKTVHRQRHPTLRKIKKKKITLETCLKRA